MPKTINDLRFFFLDLFGVLIVTSTLKTILKAIRSGQYQMNWSRFEFSVLDGKVVVSSNSYRHGKTIVEVS